MHKYYGYGKPWDTNDPNRFLNCPQTLHQWAERYGSEDRVKYFLVPDDAVQAVPVIAPAANDGDEAQVAVPEGTEFGASLKDLLLKNK
jgi:hypothetical protein